MQNGGQMVTELEVKNGMLLMKLVDSQKIKKNFMKVQDNHGSIAKIKEIKNLHTTYSTLDQDLNLLLKQAQMQDGGQMVTEPEVKNGTHSKRLPDSQRIKKSSMKVQGNHGSLVRTKRIKNQPTTYSTQDQEVNLSLLLKQMQDGGLTVTEPEVKNGMHSKRLPDSQKIKKNSMKVQDNHGSQAKTKEINNLLTTYSTLDQDLNLSHKPILINLFTEMGKI
jgi:hypothetical protein